MRIEEREVDYQGLPFRNPKSEIGVPAVASHQVDYQGLPFRNPKSEIGVPAVAGHPKLVRGSRGREDGYGRRQT
jgi:hypothetical protein